MKRQDELSQAMVDLRNRHLDFYLDLAGRGVGAGRAHELPETRPEDWADALATELDNLRAALSWAIESGQEAKALDLAGTVAPLWDRWERWSEARHWLERTLAGHGENRPQRARALSALGRIAHIQGDHSISCDRYLEAANAYKEMGDDLEAATALGELGWSLWYDDRSAEAIPLLEEAILIFSVSNATRVLAKAMTGLAWCHWSQGNWDEAVRVHEEGTQILRDSGDRSYLADRLVSQANIHGVTGDQMAATRVSRETLDITRELGDRRELLGRLAWAAPHFCWAGSLSEAKSVHEEQLKLAIEVDDAGANADAHAGFALIARARGDFESACELYTEAIVKTYEVRDPSYIVQTRRLQYGVELGVLLVSRGLRGQAKRRLLEAVATSRNASNPILKLQRNRALDGLAIIAEQEGDLQGAIALREEAFQSIRDEKGSGPDVEVAESEVWRAKGDYAAALAVLEQGLQRTTGVRKTPISLRRAIGRLLHEVGRDHEAAARLEEGMGEVSKSGFTPMTSSYREVLAAVTAAAGDLDRSFEVLQQLDWARNFIGPAPRIAETLAKIKAARGEWEAAARLIGAGEVLRSELSSPLPEWELEAHESCAARVRDALGTEAFETAVDQGRESGEAREIEEALA